MNPQNLIDRVSALSGLDLPALASRLGLQERTLRRIRSGEFKLSDQTHRHLLDIERLSEKPSAPKLGKPNNGSHAARVSEDAAPYNSRDDEALRLVLARITAKHGVNDLAALISEFAEDQDLSSGLRSRVVKILSELIPQRMK